MAIHYKKIRWPILVGLKIKFENDEPTKLNMLNDMQLVNMSLFYNQILILNYSNLTCTH